MKKIFLFIIFLLLPLQFTNASSLGEKLSGMILLDVERNGEAWYVYPEDNKRYFLGRPDDAFDIMRELGLGITEVDFQKIAQAGMPVEGDKVLAGKLAGKIILQVEKNGEAWYIHPKELKKYYLGRPADAFRIMRELSLGISRENLAQVHKPGYDESLNQYSKYEYRKTISTIDGNFYVDVIEVDLNNPKLKIITDTSNKSDCDSNCSAITLAEFALRNDGFTAINATYFDTSAGKMNYSFYPVYNSNLKKMINEDQLKYWTTGPILAFDENNKFYYFKDSREFKSVENFESTNGVKLQAALGNKPRLIEDYKNLLIEWDMDEKQLKTKSTRNAIAYKDNKIYLVIARNATVPNLANIMKAMKMEYALNLDGGFSSAMYYNDEYMFGPGRDIVNAIIFSEN